MHEQTPYDLASPTTTRRTKRVWPRIVVLSVATLALVLAVMYGPLLWNGQTDAGQGRALAAQPGPNSLFDDQDALANLYDAVAPSVVNIQVRKASSGTSIFPFTDPEMELPFQFGQGSGFIYDNDGHIVTNNHVVEDADEVTVVFHNGFWADAEVVATDPQADLAVIKVTPPEGFDWQPLTMADGDNLRVGHMVIAIGNPFGLAGTMTRGIVSAEGRGLPVGDLGQSTYTLPDVIQTDTAINPGNSGGPLLNLNGEVVGVNFAIESSAGVNSGVGFAIPVQIVERVVPELINDGEFEYAYLGLSGSTISPSVAKQLELPGNRLGVYVAGIVDGGPSADAGLQGATRTIETETGEFQVGGDIIIAIDDSPVVRFEDLVSYLVTKAAPGQDVELTILRDGKEMTVSVTLGKRPSQLGAVTSASRAREVNARDAINIALEQVQDDNLLQGEIGTKIATPDTRDGVDVWVVELSGEDQTATVVVEKATGDVLEVIVE